MGEGQGQGMKILKRGFERKQRILTQRRQRRHRITIYLCKKEKTQNLYIKHFMRCP